MDFGGPVSESDMLYMSGDPKLALEILEAHLETNPDDFEALWRAARASVVIGIDVRPNGASDHSKSDQSRRHGFGHITKYALVVL